MKDLARGLWRRAKEALVAAKHTLSVSPDAAGSRAYYAALYAVSAHFAVDGKVFKKHSSVEAAVHRDLVKTGQWPKELGGKYSVLVELRTLGDYGDLEHVSTEEGRDAIQMATDILYAVGTIHPEEFTGLDDI